MTYHSLPGERTILVQREGFASLTPQWEDLLEQSPVQSIFFTPQWHELCWQNLRDEGWQLLLMAVRAKESPIGIAPLRRRQRTICFIGSVEVSDYLDFVLQTGDEETFYRAFLDALKAEDWDILDLHCLQPASPTLVHLPPLARREGLSVILERESVSPAMALPDTWEEFLGNLNKKYRHELRRKLRRLTENNRFRYYYLEGEEVAAGMDDFLHLHRISGHEKAAFMDGQMEAFFRAMVDRLAARNWARLYFLEVGETRVSTALCFQYGQEMLLYNSGFDPAYRSLAVGLLLKSFCIRDAIESGMKRFDFLRGSEHYKYELGGVDVPVYRCVVQRV